jgi:amidohydrolase
MKWTMILLLSAALIGVSVVGRSQDVSAWTKQNLTALVETYVHLHKNPELSFGEKETAAYVAAQLKAFGYKVTEGIGGHGVVAVLENGQGPSVLVRADLDALPIVEQTDLPYASKKKVKDAEGIEVGTMHACGHDIHMTCWLGTAKFMAENKNPWKGKAIFLGQPAEERGSGARAMLDDKLFGRFGKPDFAVALHCSATMPTGIVSIRGGYVMANVDSVDIKIKGRGGHGAYPHTTIDPIVIAAKLVLDLQTIVSREVKPIESAVVTVGSIHAGTKHNIVPDECTLQITVRCYSDDVRKQLLAAIERKAKAAADSAGAPMPEIKISEGTPSLKNDEALAARLRTVFESKLGKDRVQTTEAEMGGEDFSHFGREGIPSVMFRLGTIEPRKYEFWSAEKITPPSLHSSKYAPEPMGSIETGVNAMSWGLLDLFSNNGK